MKNLTKKRVGRIEREETGMGEAALQPWFLPRPLGWKIRSMLPNEYRRKMRYYFDDYGCLRCGRKTALQVQWILQGMLRIGDAQIGVRIGKATRN
jgi:hypothetical protein